MSPSLVDTSHDSKVVESSSSSSRALCHIVTPVGMLGYGFEDYQTIAALDELSGVPTPTAIILDSGSTDSGPSKLALGTMTCPRDSYLRDLGKLLSYVVKYNVPLLTSSAGGDGSNKHVDEYLEFIQEIADRPENKSWKLKVLAIYSEVDKGLVMKKLETGQVTGCGSSVPALTVEILEQTPTIVAQVGPEPFLQAMAANPDFDIVIGGRAYDPSPYIAFCAFHALKTKTDSILTLGPRLLGAFTHMGKIMECGGICATPKSLSAMATVYQDGLFDIKPLDPKAKCTPLSVAAHTLYEKSRPDILSGPGGYLDLSQSQYEQLADGLSVRVRGATFHSTASQSLPYRVKLEGARVVGFRTLIMGSFRDPIMIPQIHSFLAGVKRSVAIQHTHIKDSWDIGWHVYGLNETGPPPKEVMVVAEVIADSQAAATSIASSARVVCAHGAYPGQKATAGNFAMGIGGRFELETAECAEFSVYHLIPLDDGQEGASAMGSIDNQIFHWRTVTIGRGEGGGEEDADGSARPLSLHRPSSSTAINGKSKGEQSTVEAQAPPKLPSRLVDVAKVVRSKNSGPYEITLDVVFDNPAVYQAVKRSGILSGEVIARLYGLRLDQLIWCGFFDVALAFKATIPRMRDGKPSCSGGFMEDDVHGCQQYLQLMDLMLDKPLVEELAHLYI